MISKTVSLRTLDYYTDQRTQAEVASFDRYSRL